ncbi:stage II sporulation protein M [Pseudoxanthomonas dokdonensis]|uniref:Membrane protein n=1 Tax=Pseudoxanthomonas dokdonensis TaxID=344882 RepID=A0A0R0CEX6_9GAMM|nr:stage II sporulation protein M [Pseudoxanthomonas dokdonensis]KRG68329.1 membrane protein [Pseudoxanthomonas dokdonensis]
MRQEQFVARHQPEWDAFEQWLRLRGESARLARRQANTSELNDEDVPARYRRICEQLALARRRGYSPVVTARLQQLMQDGHQLLYRTPPPHWRRALYFILAGFPRLVRQQAACMWAACALFVLPLLAMFVLLQIHPELIHAVLDPLQIAEAERSFDPSASHSALGRESGSDWQMFGHYTMNNISIGLRTFASGLLFCVGSILVLIFNGMVIGAVFGHLYQIGYGDPLFRFVAGHAPFELTAIVIAGGAGLRLGFNLLAPGRRSRIQALVDGGRIGARLCLGVALMLLLAAFIEAFWSSTQSIPGWIKFSVSGVLWTLVALWLWRGGQGSSDED